MINVPWFNQNSRPILQSLFIKFATQLFEYIMNNHTPHVTYTIKSV